MHIETLQIRNFRRLKDVRIDLASDISIFVGANNSGKTSASHAVQLFTSTSREHFSIHDFSVDTGAQIDAFGEGHEAVTLPTISLDIWFRIDESDLHRVIDLLPSLAWEGSLVGIRVELAARDPMSLLAAFREAREQARANIRPNNDGGAVYHPPPRTLCDFLSHNHSEKLRREYGLHYYVLDRAQFDEMLQPAPGYKPMQLTPEKGRGGKEILGSMLRVDFLHAQRHLSDASGGSRAEDLSRRLSRFYERNLEKRGDDYDALRALAESEAMLNEHLKRVFEPTLTRLADLGYPGLSNPRLLIRSALNPAAILGSHDGARVHYALGDSQDGIEPPTLPDRYNGLGFKNLIYMVVELLDLHSQWMDIEENRPPLHLIFIEEPEAHLHAQLQQVFIRKVLDILRIEGQVGRHHSSQLVVTTHSSHILYERGFRPIRYFRRSTVAAAQTSEVLNLSAFYNQTANPTRDFLERYLKLTHCDLFFADAAILVEGNVERLLLPQMIATSAPRLQAAYLSILEIGGAFGHRFRSLIEFLGITALVITDIDSVTALANDAEEHEAINPAEEQEDEPQATGACMTHVANAVTSNQTLIQWLPQRRLVADLLMATPEQRTQSRPVNGGSLIRVAYQSEVNVTWNGETVRRAGRTFEEAFAFENLVWCQHADRADLNLRFRGSARLRVVELIERIHNRIKSPGFKKTDFALALLAHAPTTWIVPEYIANALRWLEDQIAPLPAPVDTRAAEQTPPAAA